MITIFLMLFTATRIKEVGQGVGILYAVTALLDFALCIGMAMIFGGSGNVNF